MKAAVVCIVILFITAAFSTNIFGSVIQHVNFNNSSQATIRSQVVYVHNSTTYNVTIDDVKTISVYLQPNPSYSSYNITDYNWSQSGDTIRSSATGFAVINSTTYLYNFGYVNQTYPGYNNLAGNISYYSFTNQSGGMVYNNTPGNEPYTIDYVNQTWYNITYNAANHTVGSGYVTNSSTVVSFFRGVREYAVYRNNAGTSTPPRYVLIAAYDLSWLHNYTFSVQSISSGSTINAKMKFDLLNLTGSGNITINESDGNYTVVNSSFHGTMLDNTGNGSFIITIMDSNATMSIKNSTIEQNLTGYVDPHVYWKNFWWGRAELAEAKSVWTPLSYDDTEIITLAYSIVGFIVAVMLGGGFWSGAAITGFFATTGFNIANFWNGHSNTGNTVIAYSIGGVSYSWLFGVGLWGEWGIYSNRYLSSNGYSYISTPWEYFPYWNAYYCFGGQYVEAPHQSPWPSSPWNPPW